MTVIDKILSEWSYRCSDGIVDMNNPTKRAILNAILEENGVNLLKEDQNDDQNEDLTDIFNIIGKADVITKTDVFDRLAQYTLEYYGNTPEMKDLKTIFPYKVNKVHNWKSYVPEDEKKDNRGKEVEVFLKNYAIKNKINSELISGGKGKDVKIGNATVESKSDAGKNINTKLQTTYYSPNVYYAFVNNVSGDDAEVRIVAGDLLRKVSFGKDLDETAEDFEKKVKEEVEKSLQASKLDFAEMIKTALVQGPVTRKTSFFVGNKLKVRFVIYFEPAYSKEKKQKSQSTLPQNEELDEDYYEED